MNVPTPVPTPTTPGARKSARAERQRALRELQRGKRLEAEAKRRAREEETAERLAPAVQRNPVLGADGSVFRHATLVRDGVTFKRTSPVSHLVNCGGATYAHGRAAERLARAWEDGGRGVGTGAGGYGERTSTLPQTGYISDNVVSALAYQTRCRQEYAAAQTWCGALFPALQGVALDGLDVAAWGRKVGFAPQKAAGYVVAALDRLCEFYAAIDKERERPPAVVGIRSAVVVP